MALAAGPSAKKTFTNALSLIRRKGLVGLISRMAQTKDFDNLGGTFKGMDQLGNEYYEDKTNINGRYRYVVYAGGWRSNDPSTVPAEWHGWLSAIVDETPIENPPKPLKFKLKHQPMAASNMGAAANNMPPGWFKPDEVYDPSPVDGWRNRSASEATNTHKAAVKKAHDQDGDWAALDRI